MVKNQDSFDVIIVGAGPSGLMCAKTLAERNLLVCVVDMGNRIGRKILISGGGHCNFTNTNISYLNYHGNNNEFVKYAISQFGPKNVLEYVKSHNIETYQKEKGRYFCKKSSKDIVDILISDCKKNGVVFVMDFCVNDVQFDSNRYIIIDKKGKILKSKKLVIASGGISYPKLGVSSISDMIAKKFRMKIEKKYPVLCSLLTKEFQKLVGMSMFVKILINNYSVVGDMLFAHHGISGPVVYNVSLYMPAKQVIIDFLPEIDIENYLIKEKMSSKMLKNVLGKYLPNRFADFISGKLSDMKMKDLDKSDIEFMAETIHKYKLIPVLDGFDHAEATKGGVSCDFIDMKSFESKKQKGLFFIGECLDVVGDLGGYNLQWAFSSGYCCAKNMSMVE